MSLVLPDYAVRRSLLGLPRLRPQLPHAARIRRGLFGARPRDRRGAIVVPDVGEVEFLKNCLYAAPGNVTLKLYRTDVTPAEGDTHASYTVANFTNYVDKTLTATQSGSTWAVPTTTTGTSSSAYGGGTPQSWTCGATGNTIYGYWWEIAGPVLKLAEKFATARVLAENDVLNLTPRLEAT